MSEESAREVEGREGATTAEPDEGARAESEVAARRGNTMEGAAETPKLKLRRLKIEKWRNALPRTELHFGDGIHALLGKNGAGKTTLLKLISMCVRGDFGDVAGEEMEVEYDLTAGALPIRVHVVQRGPQRAETFFFNAMDVRIEVSIDVPDHGCFSLRSDARETSLQRPNGELANVGPGLQPRGFLVLAAVMAFTGLRAPDRPAASTLVPNALKSAVGAQRLDEGLEYFRWLASFDYHENWGSIASPYIQVHREPGAATDFTTHLIPADPKAIPSVEEALDKARWLEFSSETTPFLAAFAERAGFERAEMVVQFVEKRGRAHQDFLFGGTGFRFDLKDGGAIAADLLSYGQGRFLAFLHYAACNPSILIADELTNGLHHEWIEACVEELEKRQSFVATQNPLLIDYLPVTSAKDAETAFIQCRMVEKDGKQWMHWRNTTPEEGERFWKSYATGVQFISEILRTEGLW